MKQIRSIKHRNTNNEDGFSLMEVMLTTAIILILGSTLVVASNAAMQGSSRSFMVVNTAATLTRIDRHIRESVNNTHIPYWANPMPYVEALNADLFRSRIGGYIMSISIIFDNNRNPRGIEVTYTVNNHEARTAALFPSIMIVGITQ
ncbi:MAG: prepilin-type N-terminal cleavage/methylation domain-containing protein [Treponema sp.]|nr:prepilin-type N-terminal cleavage/methylation domain-containing protein [Treponema sp.]